MGCANYSIGILVKPRKKKFVSCNDPKKKGYVSRNFFFSRKMCVLCMFYVDWASGGLKRLQGIDFFE